MSNEYKEWLQEQTFESLANDNLNIKLQLLQLMEENNRLKEKTFKINLKDYQCSKEVYDILMDTNNEWARFFQYLFYNPLSLFES